MPAIKLPSEELLSEIPPGTWVAISQDQDRIISTGHSLDEVLGKAAEQGERDPFIIRIPEKSSALIL